MSYILLQVLPNSNSLQETIMAWLYDPMVGKLVAAIVGIIIIVTVSKIANRSITKYVDTNDSRYRLRKIVTIVSYVIIIFVVSVIFSDRLGGLTVAFGVAGAGIAFALQEVIVSFAGWFAVSFASFYSPGDRVQLGGIRGDVIDVSFLRTTLMEVGEWVDGDLYTGRVVRVANSFVFKEPVFNYSGDFPFLWDEIKIPVRYGGDHQLARKIINDAAIDLVGDYAKNSEAAWLVFSRQFLLEQAVTAPIVTLVANDNWLEFTLRYVVDYKKRRGTKDALFTQIVDEVAKTDGKVEFASATYELVAAPPVEVRMKG
ncbi:MAG: mechanosensitive ion channel domain-containing protein [Pyrinomonadaceae bacterium]